MDKQTRLKRMMNDEGIISALAIDQRGALKKMMHKYGVEKVEAASIEEFKKIVSEELTPYSSAILLDPEYGLPAAEKKDSNAGLLLAYEQTGYDATKEGRLPDLLPGWSVKRLKEAGADAVKFLLYYDVDESEEINEQKQAFVERIGSECVGEEMPFFLELVSYDGGGLDANSAEYARVKPHKVNEMMKEFAKDRYQVDVLKVEVPVNMNYVEGFDEGQVVYSKKEAKDFFVEQSHATKLPFIFLSAGVSADLFRKTLLFAADSGSTFNGVLCGRATWADGVKIFVEEGDEAARQWMRTCGKENIRALTAILSKTASKISCNE